MEDNDEPREEEKEEGGGEEEPQQQTNKTYRENSTHCELVFRLNKPCDRGGRANIPLRVGRPGQG